MRIATFNANSIRTRLAVIERWLGDYKPDVLCVQETKAQDADFPRDAIEATGYHVVFKGEKSYNGVAILSREPAEETVAGFDDDGPADETRLLRARVGRLTVVNTYVPQGREVSHEMYTYKLKWFERLRNYFDRHFSPDDPLIWTGDMNVAQYPIDVYAPEKKTEHVCYHDAVRKAFTRCCEWGFIDVFRKLNPEAVEYTFYDYRMPHAARAKRGWRIDYIEATAPLAAKCSAAAIDLAPRLEPKPSDHTFLYADFDV
jgi:exodeoxyribonuclease-3